MTPKLKYKNTYSKGMSDPLVSVITATHNSEQYINQCIESVIAQDYRNIEYVIIDGQSTDDTVNIVESYSSEIDYFVSESDRGIYHAMNKGIKASSGDIIGILNSDDSYRKGTVSEIVKASKSIANRKFVVHGKIARYDRTGEMVGQHGPKKVPKYHLMSTPFKHPAMFASRDAYDATGLYDENTGLAADYDWMLRSINENIPSLFIDEVLTNVNLVGISTSGVRKASYQELFKIISENCGSKVAGAFGILSRLLVAAKRN